MINVISLTLIVLNGSDRKFTINGRVVTFFISSLNEISQSHRSLTGGLVEFFVKTKNTATLARETAIFCSKQTSEEGDLLFLVRIKPEQVEERVSWILRANLPAGWLGIESVEIWQQGGR